MKLLKVGAVVLGLHLLGFILIFVYPGCSSTPRQENAALPPAESPDTLPAAPAEAGAGTLSSGSRIEASPLLPPADAVTRQVPTRPTAENFAALGIVDPAAEPPPAREYTVVAGDSLSRISRKTGATIDELAKANNLTRNATLRVGQKLKVPGSAASPAPAATFGPSSTPADTPAPSAAPGGSYTVQAGDSLYTIARKTGTSVPALRAANSLTSDTLRIGQRLNLPSGSSAATPPAAAPVRPSTTPALSAPPPSGGSHTVAAGETIGAIASRYGVSAPEIMRVNNISDPRKLRVGQTLSIPGGSSRPSTVRPAAPKDAAPVSAPAIRSDELSAPALPLSTAPELPAATPAPVGVLPSAEEEVPMIPVLPPEEPAP